jgi:hypothetical protein
MRTYMSNCFVCGLCAIYVSIVCWQFVIMGRIVRERQSIFYNDRIEELNRKLLRELFISTGFKVRQGERCVVRGRPCNVRVGAYFINRGTIKKIYLLARESLLRPALKFVTFQSRCKTPE